MASKARSWASVAKIILLVSVVIIAHPGVCFKSAILKGIWLKLRIFPLNITHGILLLVIYHRDIFNFYKCASRVFPVLYMQWSWLSMRVCEMVICLYFPLPLLCNSALVPGIMNTCHASFLSCGSWLSEVMQLSVKMVQSLAIVKDLWMLSDSKLI